MQPRWHVHAAARPAADAAAAVAAAGIAAAGISQRPMPEHLRRGPETLEQNRQWSLRRWRLVIGHGHLPARHGLRRL